MQTYPVSRERRKELSKDFLRSKIAEVFGGAEVTEKDGMLLSSFLAIKEFRVGTDGTNLLVETLMEPRVPGADQIETIKKYNLFLEVVTGFTSKERAKRLQAAAKKGGQDQ